MTRLIDAEKLKKHYAWWDDDERRKLFDQIVDAQPTVDAVPLDGSFLKMSKGDYLIYNRHWLYEHFDQEIDIQRSVMKSMGYEYAGKNTDAVRHGKWIEKSTGGERFARCSECGYIEWDTPNNYCPNCGARMDEE